MSKSRVVLLIVLVALIAAFFAFDLKQYFTLEYFKPQQAAIDAYYQAHPLQTAAIYFAIYVAVTGLSLPGAAIMTLAGGAIFGLLWGTVIVSFASTIGATLAFLAVALPAARLGAGEVRRQAEARSTTASRGRARSTSSRCAWCPRSRSSSINLVMGLTPIARWTFYWVSQVGMLAGTIVYVYAGTQLAQITSLAGLVSPGLIGSFVLLGLFPLVAKKIARRAQGAQGLRAVDAAGDVRPQPGRDRRRLGGPGVRLHRRGGEGEGDAGREAQDGRRLPQHRLRAVEGADPHREAAVADQARAGVRHPQSRRAEFDFADVMERVQRVVRTIEPHDSVERYTGLGVECLQGEAKITSPWSVEVARADGATQTLTTRAS